MSTGVIQWSTTAASNSTADTSINWAEGQAPSSVNDSARAMMAAVAKWRDDITGIIVTGGTGTAYTYASNQVISSNLNGMTVQFAPGSTNTGAVTLSVDGQTAQPLRFIIGTDLPAGTLIAGSLYQATYRASITTWQLHAFDCRQWVVPLGSALPYFGGTAPNSAFVFPYGQSISRTTYATLFSLVSTQYGAGDGINTFGLPDLRGRVLAGKDDMGGSAASRLTATYGVTGTTLGGTGGDQSTTIVGANLPAYTPAGSVTVTGVTVTYPVRNFGSSGTDSTKLSLGASNGADAGTLAGSASGTATFTGTAQGGISTPIANVQPTYISNYIMRVI